MSKNFRERASNEDEAAELERRYSVDELVKNFTPEDVCLQESCNAAEYRLFQEHITDIDLPKVEAWLTHMTEMKKWNTNRVKVLDRILGKLQHAPAQSEAEESVITRLQAGIERLSRSLRQHVKHIDARLKVGQFLFSRLVVAPWNTTEAFVRSQLERDGSGRMDLNALGRIADPSGRGEGFSFVRISKLQAHTGGAATATAASSKARAAQQTKGDGANLSRMKAEDHIKLLMAMGVPEKEARAVPRWDRPSLIRHYATEFKKKGKAPQFHKYAKQTADASVAGGGDDAAVDSVEHFQKTAQQIWSNQKAALSSTQLLKAASAEGKLLRDRLQQDANDSEEDDEPLNIAESIKKLWESRSSKDRVAADESGGAAVSSKKSSGGDKLEDLKSLRKFLDSTGESSKSVSSVSMRKRRVQVDAGADTSSFAATIQPLMTEVPAAVAVAVAAVAASPPPAAADANITGGAVPTSTLAVLPATAAAESIAWGDAALPIVNPGADPTAAAAAVAAPAAVINRPRKVVKRVSRIIKSDGSESIKIEFILSQHDVERVQRASERLKRDREIRRAATAVGGLAVQDAETEEPEATETAQAATASMSIRFGQMKQRVEQDKALQKQQRQQLAADPYSMKRNKGTKSSRRNVSSSVSQRVPRISFAVRLEKELMDLWNMKGANVFHDPVSATEVPSYYVKIQNPICLSTIRDNIAACKYETAAQFEADVQLMATNAETFNGHNHHIAAIGRKMVENLRVSLLNERKNLGEAHDPILYMEDAIQRKKLLTKKGVLQGSSLLPTSGLL